jgi:hypothetical protein
MSDRILEMLRSQRIQVQSREEWEEMRERGHAHWLLWEGVLKTGVPFLLVALAYLYVVQPIFSTAPADPLWNVVLTWSLIGATSGVAVAEWAWRRADKRFR